jgi:hypothetical protein
MLAGVMAKDSPHFVGDGAVVTADVEPQPARTDAQIHARMKRPTPE